jgi:hypothetical protein
VPTSVMLRLATSTATPFHLCYAEPLVFVPRAPGDDPIRATASAETRRPVQNLYPTHSRHSSSRIATLYALDATADITTRRLQTDRTERPLAVT